MGRAGPECGEPLIVRRFRGARGDVLDDVARVGPFRALDVAAGCELDGDSLGAFDNCLGSRTAGAASMSGMRASTSPSSVPRAIGVTPGAAGEFGQMMRERAMHVRHCNEVGWVHRHWPDTWESAIAIARRMKALRASTVALEAALAQATPGATGVPRTDSSATDGDPPSLRPDRSGRTAVVLSLAALIPSVRGIGAQGIVAPFCASGGVPAHSVPRFTRRRGCPWAALLATHPWTPLCATASSLVATLGGAPVRLSLFAEFCLQNHGLRAPGRPAGALTGQWPRYNQAHESAGAGGAAVGAIDAEADQETVSAGARLARVANAAADVARRPIRLAGVADATPFAAARSTAAQRPTWLAGVADATPFVARSALAASLLSPQSQQCCPFSSEDTLSTDNFHQLASVSKRACASSSRLPTDGDKDGPEFKYDDNELHARDADSSDYSIHQFPVADDGRDGPKSTDHEDQGFTMRRSQALPKGGHFGCEGAPSTDTFIQVAASHALRRRLPIDDDADGPEYERVAKEFHARDADCSDYPLHQFLAAVDGRDGPISTDDEDRSFAARRSQALAKEDHLINEKTPGADALGQVAASHESKRKLPIADEDGPKLEYGDLEPRARGAGSSNDSVRKLFTTGDGRDRHQSTHNEDQGLAMCRSQALPREDHSTCEGAACTAAVPHGADAHVPDLHCDVPLGADAHAPDLPRDVPREADAHASVFLCDVPLGADAHAPDFPCDVPLGADAPAPDLPRDAPRAAGAHAPDTACDVPERACAPLQLHLRTSASPPAAGSASAGCVTIFHLLPDIRAPDRIAASASGGAGREAGCACHGARTSVVAAGGGARRVVPPPSS